MNSLRPSFAAALLSLLCALPLPAQDFTVTTAGGITVTDNTGGDDTLVITQPTAATQIRFEAEGRTFRVNGGALLTGNSGNLAFGSTPSITVNAGAGRDTIRVGAFTTALRTLTINGGTGDDTVSFEGSVDFSVDGLNVDLQNDDANPGSDTVIVAPDAELSGTAATSHIVIRCSRSVLLEANSRLETTGGNLTVEANQQGTATSGEFAGVDVAGGNLLTHSGGALTVRGRGGDGAGGSQAGLLVRDGGELFTSSGPLTVEATGGNGAGLLNAGILVTGQGSMISSAGGIMNVTGTAGTAGAGRGIGVAVLSGGEIQCAGLPAMYITGTGGGSPESGGNMGIAIEGNGAIISANGSMILRGTAGPGEPSGPEGSWGLHIGNGATLTLPFPPPSPFACIMWLRADSLNIAIGGTVLGNDARCGVEISPLTADVPLQIHTDDTRAPRLLGLAEYELDRITAGFLNLYSSAAAWDLSEAVTRSTPGRLVLNNRSGSLRPTVAGPDLVLAEGSVVDLTVPLSIDISGPARDADYPVLTVIGGVALHERLLLTSTYPGSDGDVFIIVDNDGTDPVSGIFTGVGEGDYIAWPGSASLIGRLSYKGGDGNDVTLTLLPAGPELLTVTTTADSGSGSLRAALNYALQHPGPDTILLDPALSGSVITLLSPLSISGESVTLDARSLPAGLIIDGGGTTGLFRIFGSASLHGLTLRHGGSPNEGGAIIAGGAAGSVLEITHCSFVDNNSGDDGGAIYFEDGSLRLTHCTLAGNHASDAGGAIANECGDIVLTHCTLARNTCGGKGGAICNGATATLRYCLVAGNTAGAGSGTFENDTGATLTQVVCHVAPTAALLSTHGEFGGITPTVALLPGHPAINAATGSTITADQRGSSMTGAPDIGAFEFGAPLPDTFDAWVWTSLPVTASDAAHAPSADYDGDGQNNAAEYLALTNPASGTSVFSIRSIENSGGTFTLTFPTIPARTYTLQHTTALATGPWTDTGLPALTGNGSVQSFTIPAPAGDTAPGFYRVQLAR